MKASKMNKVLFFLVIVAIFLSVFGTALILNVTTIPETKSEDETMASGSIELEIAEEPQEYKTSGSISISIKD